MRFNVTVLVDAEWRIDGGPEKPPMSTLKRDIGMMIQEIISDAQLKGTLSHRLLILDATDGVQVREG